ncbi:MAG TPA: TetR/AcrR family transcriptional regulator [Actinophytocola sp.]|jgi:AcrR family transcriptional regulator|uniref:TetR/AcrR family transcriptional regulator n=1 Tax=Actinophytocola sp. TaxID=1872138 RepID=UPI002F923EB1
MSPGSRPRLSAAERTEQLVSAAVTAFSDTGYTGTSTDDVARLAGVSQPYVIRLFGSKQRLFVAGVERACEQVEEAFRAAGPGELGELAEAFHGLLESREFLVMLLHGFAASSDPAIGDVVRARFGRIYELVRELSGAQPEEARAFLATGMLLTVLAAMRVVGPDAVEPRPWMSELLGSFDKGSGEGSDKGPDEGSGEVSEEA